jgi:hypothetical protein
MAYQKEKKPGPFNFTIKFGDKEADFDSLNAKAGIQMLQAGILAMVRVLNPQHRPVPEDSLTK